MISHMLNQLILSFYLLAFYQLEDRIQKQLLKSIHEFKVIYVLLSTVSFQYIISEF